MTNERLGHEPGYTLITGASGGIGADLSEIEASQGASLILVARREGKLSELAERLRKKYRVSVHVITRDLGEVGAARGLFQEIQNQGWHVDTLINNAGFGSNGRFDQLGLDLQSNMVQLNITALMELTHLVLPAMIHRRAGRVLNIASTAAYQPGPMMAVYYATKAFVLHFSEAIGEELRGTGVTVTALCPGPTATGFAEVAGMREARLFKLVTAKSYDVALAGDRAMRQGRRTLIYGVTNRVMTFVSRFSPRGLNLKFVKMLQNRAAPPVFLAAFFLSSFLILLTLQGRAAFAAKPGAVSETVLRIQIPKDPSTIDWQLSNKRIDSFVIRNLHSGLVDVDSQKNQIVPALATKWTVLDSGRRYLIELRAGVKWSDGKPLTSAHVIAAWRRLLSPATHAPQAKLLYDIAGAEDFSRGKLANFDQVGIKALGDRKIEVRLRAPVVNWVARLVTSATWPIRPDLLEKQGSNWTFPGVLVTLGPYLLSSYETGNKLILERNPHYWRGISPVQKIEMKIIADDQAIGAYQRGDVDLVCHLSSSSPLTSASAKSTGFRELRRPAIVKRIDFNPTGLQTSLAQFRRAFGMAINRDEFLRRGDAPIRRGGSLIAPIVEGFDAKAGLPFDKEKARLAYQEVSASGSSELEFLIPLFDENADENLRTAQIIKSALEKTFGAHIRINGAATAQAWEVARDTASYALILRDLVPDYPDAQAFHDPYAYQIVPPLIPAGSTGVRTLEVKLYEAYRDLIAAARAQTQPRRRKEAYQKAEQILLQEGALVIPLFYSADRMLVRGNLLGYDPNAFTLCDVSRVKLKTAKVRK